MVIAIPPEISFCTDDGISHPQSIEEGEMINFLKGINVISERTLKNGYKAWIQTSKKYDAGVLQKELAKHIPDEFVKVSESGISSTDAIKELQTHGYQGWLPVIAFVPATWSPMQQCRITKNI